MRIGTIHAFCQSLLRRFPLEAALSPHFRLVDDRDAADALTEAREDMLAGATTRNDAARAGAAGRPGLGRAVRPPRGRRCNPTAHRLHDGAGARPRPDRRAAPRARRHRRRRGGDPRRRGATGRRSAACARAAAHRAASTARTSVAERAERILDWLGLDAETRVEDWDNWRERVPHHGRRSRAPPARFVNAKALADTQPDAARAVPGRSRAHRRDRGQPAGAASGRGVRRAGDARRAGAARLRRAQEATPGCWTTTT